MADTKISALTAAGSFLLADIVPVDEAGTTKGVTGTQIRTGLGAIVNASTSVQTPSATVRTYLAGSAIAVPASKLQIGSIFRWEFDMTKTAAGVAVSTFDIAVGTAGTTADTARVSFTKSGGTAAAEAGMVTLTAVCRGPLSAAGIFSGVFQLTHVGGATGLTGHIQNVSQIVAAQSAGFDVTVANLIVGLCITTGAADVITIQQVLAMAFNL